MNKKKKLFFGIFFMVICIAIFTMRFYSIDSKYKTINKEFPALTINKSINSFVNKKHTFKGFKYTPTVVYVTLDNEKKYKIYCSINPYYSNKGINDVLEIGDRLKKNMGSDTLYVFKKDISILPKYYFILKKNSHVTH